MHDLQVSVNLVDLLGLDFQTGLFTFRQIKAATNNFDNSSKIGEAGTIGYMAPEYALWGYLTHKADVYSFGVVLLEIVAGRSNTKFRPEENHFCLLDRAFVLPQKGDLREIVDPRLGKEYNEEEALRMLKVALLCANGSPELRPNMSSALAMLVGSKVVDETALDATMDGKEWLYPAARNHQDEITSSETDAQSLIMTSGGWTGFESSSRSDRDLYPIIIRPGH